MANYISIKRPIRFFKYSLVNSDGIELHSITVEHRKHQRSLSLNREMCKDTHSVTNLKRSFPLLTSKWLRLKEKFHRIWNSCLLFLCNIYSKYFPLQWLFIEHFLRYAFRASSYKSITFFRLQPSFQSMRNLAKRQHLTIHENRS
jgi:hypothetical protein